MNNNNDTTPEINSAEQTAEQKGINLKFFRELVEKSPSAEKIKQELGDWGEEYEASLPETLQKEDKEKLKIFEERKVENLPKDWEFKLARIQELEKKTFDYNQQKEELKAWTDIFGEQKPLEVQEQIKQLEEDKKAIEEELNSRIQELEIELKNIQQEKETILTNSQQKEQELTEKLNQWTQSFGDKDLEEAKTEWEDLKQRPDITVSEEQFYNDYARRLTLSSSKLKEEELTKTQKQMLEWKEKGQRLWWTVGKFLKNERKRKYAQSPSIMTIKQAREAIAELLEQTEREWEDYLKSSGDVEVKNWTLDLGLEHKFYSEEWKSAEPQGKKVIPAQQILEWIKEARTTLDYQTLFERWNGGVEYSEEHDYDGSLYLLGEYLKFKDFEVNPEQSTPQQLNS